MPDQKIIDYIRQNKATFKNSFQAVVAMSALFPISTLLSVVPFGFLAVVLVSLWLSVNHAHSAHGISKTKAWVGVGLISLLTVVCLGLLIAVGQIRKNGFPGAMIPDGPQDTVAPPSVF